ncbi:hypothetical protein DOTSEDRAFT_83056 [Dothistroma septosporum NZE10]|uniref:Ribosome biogenesis regulatory protein n=1 Tax=Dothistroma septosporum (strain NZE10 / CBS 128990) TaxID=675120 RepID=M2WJV4_DOTSN|nr:hypothetical protein DOTSEDRAFT_83056 [Dothistroma septosporum NZE10]
MADSKAQPYVFDLGHMLVTDSNPIPSYNDSTRETTLTTTARDCAEALINQLLTACPISKADDGAFQITLPAPETHLPREKPVPKEKEKTKWEKFAEKKGIKGKRKDGKLQYDEAKGDWVPKYGYKGKSATGGVEADWIMEVDEKAERKKADEEENKRRPGKPSFQKKNPNGGDVERRDRKLKARKGK